MLIYRIIEQYFNTCFIIKNLDIETDIQTAISIIAISKLSTILNKYNLSTIKQQLIPKFSNINIELLIYNYNNLYS